MLVVRLGAFGDVVRTLPAAFALRRRLPGARLAWLVEPGSAPLLERLPWLDEVLVFPRSELEAALARWRAGALLGRGLDVRRTLRDRGFDCVVDFHGILKSGVLTRCTGAGRRVGLAPAHVREGAAFFYTEHVRPPVDPCSRWARNAALAAQLGASVDATPIPGLAPSDTAQPRGRHAVLHPGSSAGTPHKRYPVQRFAEVARVLARELGAPCVVTCGPDPVERARARALVERAGDAAQVAETGGDVGALISQLSSARVVVSGDTGPLHLASLLGTPVVQILGPTHPVQNEPWPHTPWARAHLPLPCSPCRRGCDAAPCMELLPVADIVDAARRALAWAFAASPAHVAPASAGAPKRASAGVLA